MAGSLASKMLRLKQLSLLGPMSPRWGVIPSLAPLSSPDSSNSCAISAFECLASFRSLYTLEAAFREVFIDRNCHYWELPGSISLDCLSLLSESGLRGRGCVHWNVGSAKAVGHNISHLPTSLLPGLCAKTAFSYEQCKNIWTKPVRKQNLVIKTETGETETESEAETETGETQTGELEFGHWRAYNASAKTPHVTVSGIFGCTLEAWLSEKRDPFGAELFGSVSFEFQHGEFRKTYGDFTKFDARVDSRFDIASALVNWSANSINSSSFLPRLNLNLQQQIVGPLVFRVNSKVAFDSASPSVEDTIFSFNYSVTDPESGQVVAWWSPKRKEGMFEMRVIEF
ncbi:protein TRIGALACTOSYLDIACYLGLYCEROL 4, chloroplastic-like [Bidens hawaiensis]|uniref:protein TRIGALACTOSYLDIACYLGLYCEROL 4, chloroplastic-like n=1 Tax=Bidens hawaiensis TaxID=980011 RepID=UPI0040498C3E